MDQRNQVHVILRSHWNSRYAQWLISLRCPFSHKDQAAARMGRVRVGGYKRPGIRVEPKNEDLRRVMFHPVGKIKFRSTGSVEWPDDQFTRRRIRDGDVIVVDATGSDRSRRLAAPASATTSAALATQASTRNRRITGLVGRYSFPSEQRSVHTCRSVFPIFRPTLRSHSTMWKWILRWPDCRASTFGL